jgi:hypothetical protein
VSPGRNWSYRFYRPARCLVRSADRRGSPGGLWVPAVVSQAATVLCDWRSAERRGSLLSDSPTTGGNSPAPTRLYPFGSRAKSESRQAMRVDLRPKGAEFRLDCGWPLLRFLRAREFPVRRDQSSRRGSDARPVPELVPRSLTSPRQAKHLCLDGRFAHLRLRICPSLARDEETAIPGLEAARTNPMLAPRSAASAPQDRDAIEELSPRLSARGAWSARNRLKACAPPASGSERTRASRSSVGRKQGGSKY